MKKALRIVGWILFAVYVLAVLGVIGYGVTTQYILKKDNAPVPGATGLRPNFDKLDLGAIPTDEAGKIRFAYDLYTAANENFKNIPNAAYAINCSTIMMGATVTGYQYMVKNADEYFYTEYSFALGGGLMDMMMGAISPESTVYAARRYTNKNLDVVHKQLILNPTKTDNENGKPTFHADWTADTLKETELEKPVYYRDQTAAYEYTEQRILPETILSAEIEYVEDEGYYKMVLELDVENPKTTEITLPNLRQSSGSDDAHYYGMTEEIHIWDNGYFRYFRSQDNWKGKLGGVLTLDSQLDYITNFYYDDTNCDPANYQDMTEWKEAVLAK